MKRKHDQMDTDAESKGIELHEIPREVIYQIMMCADNKTILNFSFSCHYTYNVFHDMRSESIDELRLFYLNHGYKAPSHRTIDSRLIKMDVDAKEFRDKFFSELGADSFAGKLVEQLFQHNATSDNCKFVVAGGFVLRTLKGEKNNHLFHNGQKTSDVDIFLMEYGCTPEHSDEVLKNILKTLDKAEINDRYVIAMYSNTLNIVCKLYDDVQIVLRRIYSIEELLVLFDLDCCRFAYDGNAVHTINEGLRAYQTRTNYVAEQHRSNQMYYKRALKYGVRNYATLFFDINLFDHLLKPATEFTENASMLENERYSRVKQAYETKFDPKYIATLCYKNDNQSCPYDEDSEFYTSLNRLTYDEMLALKDSGAMTLRDMLPESYEDDMTFNKDTFITNIVKKTKYEIPLNFAFLFASDKRQLPLFSEYYRDSHLVKKYHISRCSLCDRYVQRRSEQECMDRENLLCFDCKKFKKIAKEQRKFY
ncbi:hypothetical protein AKO1_002673 [Acrasis kona]|uniref:F-box domain-containing protein n=1 Tax=Acrasis kona TaxID=1008807 RepID=A0AAW2ZQU1_9EUKA